MKKKKVLVPLGDRVLLKVKKITKKDAEGNKITDIEREGKVIKSNNKQLAKGDTVYYNPYGGVNIECFESNNSMLLCVDFDDIYIKL